MPAADHSPLVSVVVPTYNRKTLLNETLQSILGQVFADFELIIVDNLSQDGTGEYVQGLQDQRIRYFRNENHGIIATNRNFGIRKARGKYVAFCDDDDLWLPEKLQKQIDSFSDVTIAAVASNYTPFGDVRMIRKNIHIAPGCAFRDYTYDEILLHLNPIISSSAVVRKDVFQDVGVFDESEVFRFIEDWELWLRVSQKGDIRILADPLVRYRMLRKAGRDQQLVSRNTLKIIEKHRDCGLISPTLFKRAQGNCSLLIGKACLEANDTQGAGFFVQSFLHSGGFANKFKSVIGILMYVIPAPLRKRMMDMVYFVRRPQSCV